jgi:hypothetical protein
MSSKPLVGHHRPVKGLTNDWLTPPSIIEALGPFDLDPCASVDQPWETARTQWTHGGLEVPWTGFTWMNPPFGRDIPAWLKRMTEHDNGIALCAVRTETTWFRDYVWNEADAILFLHRRPHFHYPVTGVRAKSNSGVPICLAGYGLLAMERLKNSRINGTYVSQWEPIHPQ